MDADASMKLDVAELDIAVALTYPGLSEQKHNSMVRQLQVRMLFSNNQF